MVQDQLTDYISSQMKLGVSRDAIKAALVSAGWMAVDVEDTLKKVDGNGGAQPAAAAATSAMAKPAQPASTMSMGTPAKANEPQMIRVSDLVSSSASTSLSSASPSATASTPASKADVSKFAGKISGNNFEAASTSGGASSMMKSGGAGKGRLIGEIVGGVVLLLLIGAAWYFYSENGGLADQVTSLTSEGATVNAQLNAAQAAAAASSTGLTAQVSALTTANNDLALNLSFFAIPIGGPTSTAITSLPVTISGSLAAGPKGIDSITTPRGAKIFIANSAAATIAPQLKTIIGHTIQIVGTYIPGSDQLTANTITDLTPAPAPVATSTPATPVAAPAAATSSAPMTATTSTASSTSQ